MNIKYNPKGFDKWRASKIAIAFRAAKDEFPKAVIHCEKDGIRVTQKDKSSFGNNVRRDRLRVACEYALIGFDDMVTRFQSSVTVCP